MSKKKKHVWLSGHLYIEGRLKEGPRLQRKHNKDEKRSKAKQNNFTRCGKQSRSWSAEHGKNEKMMSKKKKHVWLSGQKSIERRAAADESIIKTKNEAKQSKITLHGAANNPARGLLNTEKMKK